MGTNQELKFEDVFKISTIAMRLNRSHPAIARDRKWYMQFYALLGMTVSCFTLLVNSILSHDIKAGKFAEASKNLTMAIVAITITFKYFILLRHQESISNLIRILDCDYEQSKQFSPEDQKVVEEYSKKGVKVSKLWFMFILATSGLFPLKSLYLMLRAYLDGQFKLIPMFDLTFPWILERYKNIPIIFSGLFLQSLMFDVYAGTMYTGFDPLMPVFMLHTCGQLELVSRRILKVFTESSTEDEVQEKFKAIVQKLQDIYSFIDCVKANFKVLYEYNMKTTTFLLPLSAFQIVESLRHEELNLEFFAFFCSTILHFYMPCYYSDLLMEKEDCPFSFVFVYPFQSEVLRKAIFSCGWERRALPRAARTALVVLTRATRPLVISTVFYAICLDTFAEMCRHAYALFNIMNAAWA